MEKIRITIITCLLCFIGHAQKKENLSSVDKKLKLDYFVHDIFIKGKKNKKSLNKLYNYLLNKNDTFLNASKQPKYVLSYDTFYKENRLELIFFNSKRFFVFPNRTSEKLETYIIADGGRLIFDKENDLLINFTTKFNKVSQKIIGNLDAVFVLNKYFNVNVLFSRTKDGFMIIKEYNFECSKNVINVKSTIYNSLKFENFTYAQLLEFMKNKKLNAPNNITYSRLEGMDFFCCVPFWAE